MLRGDLRFLLEGITSNCIKNRKVSFSTAHLYLQKKQKSFFPIRGAARKALSHKTYADILRYVKKAIQAWPRNATLPQKVFMSFEANGVY